VKAIENLVVVGGVAGGASAAARARRLSESCNITVFDKGPYVSFANCGLPYFVGDVIREEDSLIVASPELFRERFNIEVRTRHEVLGIDREAREILVRDLESGREFNEPYDAMVLSPGARAIRPPLPGIDLPGIFVLRTIPDSRRIRKWLEDKQATRAVVVGGGFIGLEMAENLAHRELDVTVIELADQVMPPLDPEVAQPVAEHLRANGVTLRTGDGVESFEQNPDETIVVCTSGGEAIETDIVILAIGVQPESGLARDAGLPLGERGGIRVNASMRTDDPHIWAVGDAVEVIDPVSGARVQVPLAGPANRQGRIAANNIFGRDSEFRGVQGTAVCGLFGLTVAATGASEKALKRGGHENYEVVYLHPGHHVGYYPGAKPIRLKLIFDPDDGRVLGAQATGEQGVARRIDVVAMAIQMGATVFDLEEAELCYAPQFGAAKDPVNIAGMIAANHVRGDHPLARWEDAADGVLVDVREPKEFARESIPGAIHIPLEELRERAHELPRDQPIHVYCKVGQRGYYATRLLMQRGFDVRNLSGGIETYRTLGSGPRS
jgi:NADPH-dependent 2,4-dienoyl-CoA reductase/sulfur reductase-like enzyme